MMTYEERREVQVIAEDMIEEHLNHDIKLYGEGRLWTFIWDKAKRRYGQCDSVARTIALSAVSNAGRDMFWIKNTIRHEIAHALVGTKHGHDKVWKAKAREMGVRPRSTTPFVGDKSRRPDYKWFLIHKDTGQVYQGQFKLSKSRQNRECGFSAHLRGRKAETEGNLMYVSASRYNMLFGKLPEVSVKC